MNWLNYYESLKFDYQRVMKINSKRIVGLQNLKVVGNIKYKKKYNYVTLDSKLKCDKDIVIIIDNDELRIDNLEQVKVLNYYLDNYQKNINFFKKNKFKKNYSRIKNNLLISLYKKIVKIYNYALKNNIRVKDILVINYDKNVNNNNILKELDAILSAYFLDGDERVYFIYNYMCDYLDQEFNDFNICDFQNNRCVSRRDLECKNCKNPLVYGCCFTKGRVCPNLVNNHCCTKNLSCKFFTCRYLERRGIKYRPWDYPIMTLFFNRKELKIIDMSITLKEEDIMKKLIKDSRFKNFIYRFNSFL